MVEKKQKDNVQKRKTKRGVQKGNENISPQKRMQKERMKTQFFRKEERLF